MDRRDSMILTFHVPPLAGRDYVISAVYSRENFRKISKSWEVLAPQNWTDKLSAIIRVFPFDL